MVNLLLRIFESERRYFHREFLSSFAPLTSASSTIRKIILSFNSCLTRVSSSDAIFESALPEVKRDYYSGFPYFFFNPHELTKIVPKSSTKFYCTKMHYLV